MHAHVQKRIGLPLLRCEFCVAVGFDLMMILGVFDDDLR